MSPPSLHVAASGDDGVVGIPALVVVNGTVSLPPSGNGNGNGNGLHSADLHHKKGNASASAVINGGVSAAGNGVHKESGNGSPAANGSKSEEGPEKAEKKPTTSTTTTATRDTAGRHAGLGHKSILQSDALYQVNVLSFI